MLSGVTVFLTISLSVYLLKKSSDEDFKSKYYEITKERLTISYNGFKTSERVFNLKNLTGLKLEQGLLGTKFNFGDIQFNFLGGREATIRNIPDPQQNLLIIEDLLDDGFVLLEYTNGNEEKS